jgi:hypothetical protein
VTRHDQALPVAGVVDVASDLQDLVTIGTHRIAAFTYMHLYNSDLCVEPEPGGPIAKLLPDVNAWCEKAKDERNNLAHHYGRTIHLDSTELLYSSEVAYWLFMLCLLRLADAPNAVFDHITANPDFGWLRERLK